MRHLPHLALPMAGILALLPAHAFAQTIDYGSVSGGGDDVTVDSADGDSSGLKPRKGRGARRTSVDPYIEVSQVVTAQLQPGDDVFTYSQLAAGVDAVAEGQNNGVSVSLRYERRIAWDKDTADGDTISGVANGYVAVAPGVQFQAGGLAARTRIDGTGSSVLGPRGDDDAITQVYSVYAGPSVATTVGDVGVAASYRVGYTKVEQPDAYVGSGGSAVDVFDDSVVHSASVTAGVKPFDVLPVGLGVGGTYYREDISNLDQRVEDMEAHATVTVPVSMTVQASASVGYEKVEISARDAVRDANGVPVVGGDGRYVTDKGSPRILAYDVDGLTWDAGVMWRPSRRTSLSAHVGRRYGSTSVYGTFAYAPNDRSAFAVRVYDNVAGFGGQVNDALAGLPTDFVAVRDPLSGDLQGCVASLEDGSCLAGALGSVRSSTFRARGIAASYGLNLGDISTGIGAGYDRRKFIAAPGTVLAAANGVIDENFWLAYYASAKLDAASGVSTNLYANFIQSGGGDAGDVTALGATAAYYRTLTQKLSASAALGIDGLERQDPFEDLWSASALVGLRYTF